jgi:hypothetical protein
MDFSADTLGASFVRDQQDPRILRFSVHEGYPVLLAVLGQFI